jgi:hypothetical protein
MSRHRVTAVLKQKAHPPEGSTWTFASGGFFEGSVDCHLGALAARRRETDMHRPPALLLGIAAAVLVMFTPSPAVARPNVDAVVRAAPASVAPPQRGYWLLGGDGGVFSFDAPFFGALSMPPRLFDEPCSLIVPTADRGGYYIVNPSLGGWIANFGTARSIGSLGLDPPAFAYSAPDADKPTLVGFSVSRSDTGFAVFESNGDVLTAGDVPWVGQPPHAPPSGQDARGRPAFNFYTGGTLTSTEHGYWVIDRNGGVYTFGDAEYFGSAATLHLNATIVAIVPTPDDGGYWLLGSDGGIFTFGNARFYGSTGNLRLNAPVVGMAVTPDGGGYWLVASDGGVFTFGDATFHGSTGNLRLNSPVTGMAAA